MTTTETTAATIDAHTAPTRGFPGLRCFHCGETDCVSLDGLADLSAGDAFRCRECEAEWGAADVRELLSGWGKLLAWLDSAPAVGGNES